ncbi:MAG TPA: hypothetical protein VNZ58_07915 [Thermomicrobiales bacterium]|nr:hypothetical protein [Thermomicrobiales bacterium]
MPQATDIVLDGAGYMIVPGSYTRGQDGAPEGRTGRVSFRDFFGGQRRHLQLERDRAFDGLRVGPALNGQGVQPWPAKNGGFSLPAGVTMPSASTRVPAAIVRGRMYFALGQHILECVAPGSAWVTPSVKIDTGTTIRDLCLYASNGMLATFGSAKEVTWYRMSDGSSSVLLAGEQGYQIAGYGGYAIWNDARSTARPTYLRQVTGTEVDLRILDYDVTRLVNAGARIYAVTASAVYSYSGRVSERTVANPAYVADPDPRTITVQEWSGEWTPYFQHGVTAAPDDFSLFEGYGGRIYAWVAGEVMEDNPNGDRAGWRATGLSGRRCFGGCVAGGYVVVSIESHEGMNQLWAWDGSGWWKIDEKPMAATGTWIWPLNVNDGGSYDMIVFHDGAPTYDLYRLRPRSASVHAFPASAASFTTPMIDAGERDRPKAWRKVGAVFATPELNGNLASVDPVRVLLDLSTDGGATWVTVADRTTSGGNTRENNNFTLDAVLTPAMGVADSRFVMLRARWESVSDWAPVLTGLWCEFEVLDAPARRRKWVFDVIARDQVVDRDGGVLNRTGRQLVAELWSAWEGEETVMLRDIDHDAAPVERSVRIVGIKETVPKPYDQSRWGDSVVSLHLVEV